MNIENFQAILFFKYVLLTLPLFFCQLYHQFYQLALLSILAMFVIPFIGFSFHKKGINNFLIRAIPSDAFEWKSGIRKYFVFVLPLWLGGIFGAWYVGVVPVVIILFALVVINFYELGEPLSILMSSETSPKLFLFQKIAVAQIILSAILLPLALLFAIFHPELWFIPFIEYVLISFVLWYAILLKYSFYKPDNSLVAGQLFTTIGAMSLFIPFLIPLVWILSVRFYFNSIANLKPYLDDFN